MAKQKSLSKPSPLQDKSVTRKAKLVRKKVQDAKQIKTPEAIDEARAAEGELYIAVQNRLKQQAQRLLKTFSRLGMDADDLVSDAWDKIVKAMLSVEVNDRLHFYNVANQNMKWLLQTLVKKYRKSKLRDELGTGTVKQDLLQQKAEKLHTSRGSQSFLDAENILYLLPALDELPKRDQEIINLVMWQGIKQAEVAQMLGIHPNSVRYRLDKSYTFLRSRFNQLKREESRER